MIFIVGVKIPDNLSILNGICKIYGIGYGNAEKICKNFGFLKKTKVKDINQKDWSNILQFISNNKILIENDLKKKLKLNIWHLLDVRNYRGIRHSLGLSVRGQRTHSNANTQKRLYLSRIGKRNLSFSNNSLHKYLDFNDINNLIFFQLYFDKFKGLYFDDFDIKEKMKLVFINSMKIQDKDEEDKDEEEKDKKKKENEKEKNKKYKVLGFEIYLNSILSNLNYINSNMSNDFLNLLMFSYSFSKSYNFRLINKILKRLQLRAHFFKKSIFKKQIEHQKRLYLLKKSIYKFSSNSFFIRYRFQKRWILPFLNDKSLYSFYDKLKLPFLIKFNKQNIQFRRIIPQSFGSLIIYSKYTNIFIYFFDYHGNLLKYVSGGTIGLVGKQKGSPFAGRTAMDSMIKFIRENNFKNFKVIKKGIGVAKKEAFRRLYRFKKKFKCTFFINITQISHNGCRLKKIRR